MEPSLYELQRSIYGRNGPPIFPHSTASARKPAVKRRKVGRPTEPFKLPPIKALSELNGPETLVACQIPSGFPPEYAFRALAAYAFLRTLSRELRLSPFTPNVFLRALNLPCPSRLLGQIHVNVLRILLPRLNMGYAYRPNGGTIGVAKKRRLDGIRWPLLGGDNLTYLDNYTWPLFYDDYCHLTADVLWSSMNESNIEIDLQQIGEPNDNDHKAIMTDDDGMLDRDYQPRTAYTWQKNEANEKTLVVSEPLVDSDDEYKIEEDEGNEQDDDDVIETARPRSCKRKRPFTRLAQKNAPSPVESFPTDYFGLPLTPSHITPASSVSSFTSASTVSKGKSVMPSNAMFGKSVVLSESTSMASLDSDHALRSGSSQLFRQSGMPQILNDARPLHRNNASVIDYFSFNSRMPGERSSDQEGLNGLEQLQQNGMESNGKPHSIFPNRIPVNSKVNFAMRQRNEQGTANSPTVVVPAMTKSGDSKRPFVRFSLPLHRTRNQFTTSQNLPTGVTFSSPNIVVDKAVSTRSAWAQSAVFPQSFYRHPHPSVTTGQEPPQYTQYSTAPYSARQQRISHFADANFVREDRTLEVSAEVADELQAAMSGREILSQSPVDDGSADNIPVDISSQEGDDCNMEKWSQFKPVTRMRMGVPYHRLSVAEKLDILEFLIDELLVVDFIAAEFTKRDALNGGSRFPYSCLPSLSELESLENEDECAVCRKEGDLLCCDECTSSYHKMCLGLTQGNRIPAGKWVCPECRIVDPCKFGSLRGGKKSSVDWFSLNDLLAAEQFKGNPYTPRFDLCRETTEFGVVLSDAGINGARDARRSDTEKTSDSEFMVIGSFVFERRCCADPLVVNGEVQTASLIPLNKDELAQWLSKIGSKLGSMWPITQVPLTSTEIWSGELSTTSHPQSIFFFSALNSYDPSFYWSQYRRAPLPHSMKVGTGVHAITIAELESEFVDENTSQLSEALCRDMQFDEAISKHLMSSTTLFDPYRVIASHMIRLEGLFKKAGLLHESWGMEKLETFGDAWIRNVRKSQSIPRLAFLLVKLIDSVNPRSFLEEWHKLPGSNRSSDPPRENTVLSLSARRFVLPGDWNAQAEQERRKWERCPIWGVRSLLIQSSRNGNNSNINTTSFQPSERKRKNRANPVKMGPSNFMNATTDTSMGVDQRLTLNSSELAKQPDCLVGETTIESSNGVNSSISIIDQPKIFESEESGSVELSCRRRVKTRSGVNGVEFAGVDNDDSPSSEMGLLVESEHKKKMLEIEKFARASGSKEGHWPLAGRKLFEPDGCLPPHEMYRLGRKAGAAVAPYVAYLSSHEVGQTSLFHRWRKGTLECKTYEELILRLKSVESFLDNSVITAVESIARKKSKTPIQKSIACSHRDLQTGVVEYFVADKDRKRGCWVSLESIELPPLVVELTCRAEVRSMNMQRKRKLNAENLDKRAGSSWLDKLSLVHKSEQVTSRAVQPGRHSSLDETDHELKRRKREIEPHRIDNCTKDNVHLGEWNRAVETAMLQHRTETQQFIIERTKRGLSLLPPEPQMHQLRLQRIHALKFPLGCNRQALEAELIIKTTKAEIDALKMMEGNQLTKFKPRITNPVDSFSVNSKTLPPAVGVSSSYNYHATKLKPVSGSLKNDLVGPIPTSSGVASMDSVPSTSATGSSFSQLPYISSQYVSGESFAKGTACSQNPPRLDLSAGMKMRALNQTASRFPSLKTAATYHQQAGLYYPNNQLSFVGEARSHHGATTQVPSSSPPPMAYYGVTGGYPQQWQNSGGHINHHQYNHFPHRQVSSSLAYHPHQTRDLSSYLPPQHHPNSFGSIPCTTPVDDLQVRAGFNNLAAMAAQHRQVSHPSSRSLPGVMPFVADLEPRPIEDMSQQSLSDLDFVLRSLSRHQR